MCFFEGVWEGEGCVTGANETRLRGFLGCFCGDCWLLSFEFVDSALALASESDSSEFRKVDISGSSWALMVNHSLKTLFWK